MAQPLRFGPFSGIAPKLAARQLPEGMAQVSENCRLLSGELDIWAETLKVAETSKGDGVQSIFRMIDTDGSDVWLNWLTDVDAVRGPIRGDETQRTYYTGDGEPRVTNLELATVGGDIPLSWYVLGVYPPQTAMGVSHAGGVGSTLTRSFVYTFVTTWGEESQPSPPSSETSGKTDGTWTLSGMDVAPSNSFSVTGGSWAGGIATLSVSSTFGLRVGEYIEVTGVTPSGYNTANAKITAVTATQVSYAVAINPGAWSSGGTINRRSPHNTSGMVKRIYWSETVSGETMYQFVKEIDASTTGTTVAGNAVVGEPIESIDYEMPPTDMVGLTEMPNGMMAGFAGNEVFFCEPFKPHAWPSKYGLSTTREIVGIGVSENALVCATKGTPYVINGTHPESMSEVKIDGKWPCLSKRSVVGTRVGVMYATTDGIALIAQGGSGLATENVLSRREFKKFFPETIRAVAFQERYFAWYTDDNNVVKGFIFDPLSKGPNLTEIAVDSTGSWVDPETGEMYIVVDGDEEGTGHIRKWDAHTVNRMVYDHKSKVFVLPRPVNYGAAKVVADYAAISEVLPPAQEDNEEFLFNESLMAASESWPDEGKIKGAQNSAMFNELEFNGDILLYGAIEAGGDVSNQRFLTFRLYAGGELRHTENCVSAEPFRLPAGYEESEIEVRISGNVRCMYAEMAGTVRELGSV